MTARGYKRATVEGIAQKLYAVTYDIEKIETNNELEELYFIRRDLLTQLNKMQELVKRL